MNAAIVLAGVALNLIGSFAYIRDTLRGETKPNKVTWFMWSVAPLIGAAASFSSGVTWAVVPVLAAGLFPLMIFIASFVNKNSYWELTNFDYICGGCSILALVLWAITKNPTIAVIFAILADAAAGYPTLLKAWRYPETETAIAYVLAAISVLTSFVVLESWEFNGYAFPLYLLLVNSALAIGILQPKWRRSVTLP